MSANALNIIIDFIHVRRSNIGSKFLNPASRRYFYPLPTQTSLSRSSIVQVQLLLRAVIFQHIDYLLGFVALKFSRGQVPCKEWLNKSEVTPSSIFRSCHSLTIPVFKMELSRRCYSIPHEKFSLSHIPPRALSRIRLILRWTIMLRWPSMLRMIMFKTFHTKILRLHAKPLTYPRRIDVTLRHYEPANLRNVIRQAHQALA